MDKDESKGHNRFNALEELLVLLQEENKQLRKDNFQLAEALRCWERLSIYVPRKHWSVILSQIEDTDFQHYVAGILQEEKRDSQILKLALKYRKSK